ncbi:hypothetical protein GQ600_12333 [Phytophthora cactorum]|nr:hypothetical protein GQ600_12333 [Phytophthora cactorum]
MDSNSLFAPSSTLVSDQVIGVVVQRVAPLHGCVNHDCSFITPTRLPPVESLTDETRLNPMQTPEVCRKPKISASRRERCRINQARYRKRQRQHAEELDERIRQLEEEVEHLETQRHNAPTDRSVWVVAAEYFRHFRRGYRTPMNAVESPLTTPAARAQQHLQLQFLKATTVPDVTDGGAVGAEALLENWRCFSLYHDDVRFELKRLELVSEDSLLATTRTSVTITQNTLRHLYPHLVYGNINSSGSVLASKLLNQRLVMHGSVRFDWDNATSRVVRLESNVDMLTAMLKLLENLEDMAHVFDGALITLDGAIATEENRTRPKLRLCEV